jgi:hypothetical protein
MNGNILIEKLLVTRASQQQYFQFNIPRDVTTITGILTTVQLIDVPVVSGTGQVGFLQLQSTGKANGCYNSIVKLEPAIALKSDLSLKAYQAGFTQTNALLLNGLAQRGITKPEIINLSACNNVYGNYKDLLGKILSKDIQYRVAITLWTKTIRL